MTTDSLTLEALSADELWQDQRWWAIYDESFPSSEREPRQVIAESVARGSGAALRARHVDETVGLATIHLLRDPPAVFLVYLAVATACRGEGVGGKLLDFAFQVGERRLVEAGLPTPGLIWEVDLPAEAATPEEVHHRQRRIAFFERHGGRVLPVSFLQPPVDGIAPVPMHLMYRLAAAAGLPDAQQTAALVRALYFEKYGDANGIPRQILDALLQKLGL